MRKKEEELKSCTCPICGACFVPTVEWHWTHGKAKLCSYHCYLKRDTLAKPKSYRPERRVRQFSLTGEIVATYKNAAEAARAVGYPASAIRACCKQGHTAGTGYRWEYVGEEALEDEREEAMESAPEADS